MTLKTRVFVPSRLAPRKANRSVTRLLDRACELSDDAVTRAAKHSAFVLGDLGTDQLAAIGHLCGKRTGLILPHEARVANHARSEYGCKVTLY